MKITKWYVDCVDERGSVAIAYWMRVAWGPFIRTYASTLLRREGGLAAQSRSARCAPPRIDGDSLSWSCGDIDARMARRAPAVTASMLDGAIEWRAELPSAVGSIRFGEAIVEGRGYAEVISMRVAPWNLPIRELRWGRFTGRRHAVVWIDWRGAHPLTLVASDGVRAHHAQVDDRLIRFDGAELLLEEPEVVRDASLAETLHDAGALRFLVPSRFAAMRECKWRSRGTLRGEGMEADRGWSIHEVVRLA
ncbi:MAG TPA: hypothetical protein VFO89_04480 [Thermoanaerobaculia bacterium]|nr:hypothetical protein [Thermoanaerobaculia bacterium]